jgi:hypothetical protein
MSSISCTINGTARLVDSESPEEDFYRARHLENNTFNSEGDMFRREEQQPEDGGRSCFVAGEDVRLIVVDIEDIRISDWKGGVRDWSLVPGTEGTNGVR